MNIMTSLQMGTLPGYLFHQPPCIYPFPHVVEVGDAWQKIGSGIGDERSSEVTALAEYLERRHFYMEVSSERRGTLSEVLTSTEADTFAQAFLQTTIQTQALSNVDQHVFGMTRVFRTLDFSECHVPTVMINLTHGQGDPDNNFYPERDTCGCSFHVSGESSIFGAMKESLERQFLTRFWLTKRCHRKLGSRAIQDALDNHPCGGLLQLLSKAGQLCALDISDARFPGQCVLLVYGSDDASRHVRYCAGMAYASSVKEALGKAVLELWQTFRFMQVFGAMGRNVHEVEDSYLRHFLSSNHFDTFEKMTDTLPASSRPAAPNSQNTEMNAAGLFKTLASLKIYGYLYIQKKACFGTYYTLTKFLSPSLYLHMNNSANLNLRNQYSEHFIHDTFAERQSVMVPFP
jgi:ribosomal protein S12 methylthiotransferase accessory factor YcaO